MRGKPGDVGSQCFFHGCGFIGNRRISIRNENKKKIASTKKLLWLNSTKLRKTALMGQKNLLANLVLSKSLFKLNQ